MRTIIALGLRLLSSPFSYLGLFGLMLLETHVAGAATITTTTGSAGGPIATAANNINNSVVIPGAAAITGTAIGTASVAYALDSQKQNIIRSAVGATLGGVVGVGGAIGVPPIMLASAQSAGGALITHVAPHVHHVLHVVASLPF